MGGTALPPAPLWWQNRVMCARGAVTQGTHAPVAPPHLHAAALAPGAPLTTSSARKVLMSRG